MPIIGLPNDTPREITDFITSLFELYEIRARVSEHNGISFNIYTHDHNPPHVHAFYGEYEASFRIRDGGKMFGEFPKRATKMVKQFILLHKKELLEMWNGSPFKQLPGLE